MGHANVSITMDCNVQAVTPASAKRRRFLVGSKWPHQRPVEHRAEFPDLTFNRPSPEKH